MIDSVSTVTNTAFKASAVTECKPVQQVTSVRSVDTEKVETKEQTKEQKKQNGDLSEELKRTVKNTIEKVNCDERCRKTGIEFAYHEKSKQISIKLYDKETKEVIKEIPPEKTIEMLEKMWELAGILVDEKM